MTEMNNTVKAIIASKLAQAMIDERLKHNDVVRLLGLKSKYYSSMVTSGKPVQWDKVGKSTWEILKGWTNSGERIREYSKKHNLEVKKPVGVHKPEVDNTTTPPKIEITVDDTIRIHPDSPIEDVMGAIFGKVNESASLESISKMVTAWEKDLERADRILTRTERMRKEPDEVDRLGVLLEVINELKEMGFDVDIHISPKQ